MSAWKEQFATQCKVRRAVILHGNVMDIFWEKNIKGITMTQYVVNHLTELGYQDIVCWDNNNGARGMSPTAETALSEDVKESLKKPEDNASGGTNYTGFQMPSSTGSTFSPQSLDAAGFFNILLKRFSNSNPKRQPTAYIIDGADVLFGNANALTDPERKLLLQLGHALRNSQCTIDINDLKTRQDIIVIIVPRIALIPPRFYQDNPAVTDVFVARPDRKEREAFLSNCNASLRVAENMTAGTADFQECIDALENFTYRDIQQFVRLSQNITKDNEPPLSYKKLIKLYLYGEKKSPWEDLSKERLETLDDELKKQVIGQDHVVKRVVKVIKKAYMGLSGLQHSSRQQMPKGTFFFVGPTGVGKTEMAKSMARFLFGDEDACIRFDMSEYSAEESAQRLVGAPPGYVGYEEGGQLTNAVKKRPFSVLLFDEIEKADPGVFDKFLQILEDGRLTDSKGDTVFFSETIIIFTSNIGASDVTPDDEDPHQAFIKIVRDHFINTMKRPELLNRIGEANIIPFNHLTDDSILMKIVMCKLAPLKKKLQEKFRLNFEIEKPEETLQILLKGFDKQYGGRGIANRLNDQVIEPLADKLFEYDREELENATMVAKLNNAKTGFVFRLKDE